MQILLRTTKHSSVLPKGHLKIRLLLLSVCVYVYVMYAMYACRKVCVYPMIAKP